MDPPKQSEDDSSGNKQSTSASGDGSSSSTNNRTGSISFNVVNNLLLTPFRKAVSQNRRRFIEGNFNLDLTYITDRIIAMGYPASSNEALYRNDMATVQHFLETRHKDHYTVFNLRGNYTYDVEKFQSRVFSYAMNDHHPPRLEFMAPFCQQVDDFLAQDERNVVAVHCKAGKGRTGVMICAYLVHINFYPSPRQVMDYYSIARTSNNKGVTIPSQRRYVYYFSHLKERDLEYLPLRQELIGVYIEHPPKVTNLYPRTGFGIKVKNCGSVVFRTYKRKEDLVWFSKKHYSKEAKIWGENATSNGPGSYDETYPDSESNIISRRAYGWTVPSDKRVFIQGDVRIDLYTRFEVPVLNVMRDKQKVGHVWVNTMFTCPDFCGGEFRHGDETHSYPEGATSLVEKKSVIRPKAGSASLPNTPAGSLKKKNKSDRSIRSTKRTPSFDTRKDCTRTSRFNFNSAIRRFGDRNSEPAIPKRKCSSARAEKKNSKDLLIWTEENMELASPPGLQHHCPNPGVIYDSIGSKYPRLTIEQHLKEAHMQNQVVDNYNRKKSSAGQDGNPVAESTEGKPFASGPNLIRMEKGDHVHYFPVCEIDRAFKAEGYDHRFRIIVVTRCISDNVNDQKLADEHFKVLQDCDAEQLKKKAEEVGGKWCLPKSCAFEEKILSYRCPRQLRSDCSEQGTSAMSADVPASSSLKLELRCDSESSYTSSSSCAEPPAESVDEATRRSDDTL